MKVVSGHRSFAEVWILQEWLPSWSRFFDSLLTCAGLYLEKKYFLPIVKQVEEM